MNTKIFFIAVLGCATLFAGCGKSRTGTYTGSETINSPGITPLSANNVSLNVSNDDNSGMTGALSDSSGSSSFTGTVSSDGSTLQSVSLSVPVQSAGSSVNGIPSSGCGGTYTGSLTLTDTTISGTLTLTSPQAVNTLSSGYTNSPYPTSSVSSVNPCQGATRQVSLTKSN